MWQRCTGVGSVHRGFDLLSSVLSWWRWFLCLPTPTPFSSPLAAMQTMATTAASPTRDHHQRAGHRARVGREAGALDALHGLPPQYMLQMLTELASAATTTADSSAARSNLTRTGQAMFLGGTLLSPRMGNREVAWQLEEGGLDVKHKVDSAVVVVVYMANWLPGALPGTRSLSRTGRWSSPGLMFFCFSLVAYSLTWCVTCHNLICSMLFTFNSKMHLNIKF
jgi:hypothetical protein